MCPRRSGLTSRSSGFHRSPAPALLQGFPLRPRNSNGLQSTTKGVTLGHDMLLARSLAPDHPLCRHCHCHRTCNVQPESPRHPADLREGRPDCGASRHTVGAWRRRRIRRSSRCKQLQTVGLSYRWCGGSRQGPSEADKIRGGHTQSASWLHFCSQRRPTAGWAHQHTPSSRNWPLQRPSRHLPGRR
jgi:hypothetical protein